MTEWLPQSSYAGRGDQFCRFVARQPILDRHRRIFGYELLFRSGWENRFPLGSTGSGATEAEGNGAAKAVPAKETPEGMRNGFGMEFRGRPRKDGSNGNFEATRESEFGRESAPGFMDAEAASRHIIDDAITFGMESLVGDSYPFVNCTRDLILKGLPTLLPRYTVLELLEEIEIDSEFVTACKRLRSEGYRLALDDYDFSERWEPLLHMVDYIKVDFRCSTPHIREALLERLRFTPVQMIAEKVETEDEFLMAMDEGFHYFQGYFFTRPVVLGRPAVATIINRFRFVAELSRPNFSFRRVIQLLKQEPSLSFRLLRLANSQVRGRSVTNLGTALAMIGEEQFRKMVFTAMTSELMGNHSAERLRIILQKARFCELIAPELGMDPTELYVFGMLAMVRSTLGLTVDDVVNTLKLRPEIQSAMAGRENDYWHVLQLVQSYEQGDWINFSRATAFLRSSEERVSSLCIDAQRWATEILNAA